MAEPRPELAAQGQRIRALRLQMLDEHGRPLSQEKAAQQVGVSTKAYRAWEHGRGGISVENLERLAAVLDTTTEHIRGPDGANLTIRREQRETEIREALRLVAGVLARPDKTPTKAERQALRRIVEDLGGPLEPPQHQQRPSPGSSGEVRQSSG